MPSRPHRRISLAFVLAGLSVVGGGGPLTAQTVSLDQGTFALTIQGRDAGSESFTVRRLGTGDDARVVAQAQIRMERPAGTLHLDPALQSSGSDLAVTAYQVKVSGSEQEEIYVTLGDRRFLTKIRSDAGEQEREYRASPGTLLLDAGVAHQYYFLGLRLTNGAGTTAPVIVPREGRQYTLQATLVGAEPLTLGASTVSARRFRLEGSGEAMDLWIDEAGRVLRLDVPAQGYRAVRTGAPGS